jgi:hypothetical protein
VATAVVVAVAVAANQAVLAASPAALAAAVAVVGAAAEAVFRAEFYPCFRHPVILDGALRRFYDTYKRRFAEILYHVLKTDWGQIPIILAWAYWGQIPIVPKDHFKAARPGNHFLSERPEK